MIKSKMTTNLKFYCVLKISSIDPESDHENTIKDFPGGFPKNSSKNTHPIKLKNTHVKNCSREKEKTAKNLKELKSEREFCIAKIDNSEGLDSIAFFNNPLPLSTLKKNSNSPNDLALDATKISETLKNSNIFKFDGVFCEKTVKSKMYNNTTSKFVNLIYDQQNATIFIIGTRENRIKKRFFLDNSSIFQKFLCDSKLKFDLFQKSEEREYGMSHKVSLIGNVNDKIFDFLKNSNQVISNEKYVKMAVNNSNEIGLFLDRLRSTFSVLKTISHQQVNFFLIVKLHVKIFDNRTKIKSHSSTINFVYFHLAENKHENLSAFKRLVLNVATGTQELSNNIDEDLILASPEKAIAQKNMNFLFHFLNVAYINFYFCFNGLFRYQSFNKSLLTFYKQFINDIKISLSIFEETSKMIESTNVKKGFGSATEKMYPGQNNENVHQLIQEFDIIMNNINKAKTTEERVEWLDEGINLLEQKSDLDQFSIKAKKFLNFLLELFDVLENSLSESYRNEASKRLLKLRSCFQNQKKTSQNIQNSRFFKKSIFCGKFFKRC